MKLEEKIKMFNDIFAPKSGEKVLFLIDKPHGDIKDNDGWKESRGMANEWYNIFKEMGNKRGFSVDLMEFKTSGMHNAPISKDIIDTIKKSNLVLAVVEYSVSSSLLPICFTKDNITRGAVMYLEKIMEETVFKANYAEVKKYAIAIENMLNKAIGAEIIFSTGDNLFIDLRNRVAKSDRGDCTKKGQFINFPSGEGFTPPYEGASDEIDQFGPSKTRGILPVDYNGELVKYVIKNNRIVDIIGKGKKAEEMEKFFNENESRRNIAELGVGCNPKAVITGNVALDEKVGLHIAYGKSTHFGGKIDSDMHLDIVYAKSCPIEGTTLTLINEDGSKIELIQNAELSYDLLK